MNHLVLLAIGVTRICTVTQIHGVFSSFPNEVRVGDSVTIDLNQAEIKRLEFLDPGGAITITPNTPLKRDRVYPESVHYLAPEFYGDIKLDVMSVDGPLDFARITKTLSPGIDGSNADMELSCANGDLYE